MLTYEQTTGYIADALEYISANPLHSQQELRAYLADKIGGNNPWGDATEIVLQEQVYHAGIKAFNAADKAARTALEQQVEAKWRERMDKPVEAAVVHPMTVTPVAAKTRQDHIEAIKEAYDGTDPDNRAFNLQAACRYALLNGLTSDDVANATGRHNSECSALMYPR